MAKLTRTARSRSLWLQMETWKMSRKVDVKTTRDHMGGE